MSDGFTEETSKNDEINGLFKRVAEGKKVMVLGNATLGGSNFSQRELVKNRFENVGAKQVDIVDINRDNTATVLDYMRLMLRKIFLNFCIMVVCILERVLEA